MNMNEIPDGAPTRKAGRNPLTSWAFIAGLFGAGALPCPDCGLPLAWHLWPLALLILFVRMITGRARTRREKKSPPAPAAEFTERSNP
jgi:hypothetical protein